MSRTRRTEPERQPVTPEEALKRLREFGATRHERRQARMRRRRRHRRLAVAAVSVAVAAVSLVALDRWNPAAARVRVASRPPTSTRPAARPAASTHPPVVAAAVSASPTSYGQTAAWVERENARPGTSSWVITDSTDPIEGYADHTEATRGQTITLFVSTPATSFRVDAYRMGYYHGLGARLEWKSASVAGGLQAACPVTAGTNMVACEWRPSVTITIGSAWVPGEYLLKLVGSNGGQSYIPLTVWDPVSTATYVVMSGVLTDEVFNPYGGYDLYQGEPGCARGVYPCSSRSRVVSFDRPFATGNGSGSYLGLLYPLTRFMEQHGLDVTYWTDVTLATQGDLLGRHRVLISPGHDEEWSLEMRQAVTAAMGRGVNVMFMGASAVLRKVRLEPSPLGPDREIVNYRDPLADPVYGRDDADVSANWWGQPPVSNPDSLLVGADYVGYYNAGSFPLVVSEPESWLYAGTGLAAGAEVPGVFAGDFQAYRPSLGGTPPGVEILSHSPVTVSGHPERGDADTTYYTVAGSGAGVFSSGTVGWIPALMPCAQSASSCPAGVMQQITANILRVFGAGPAGLTEPSVPNTALYYG